MLNTEREQNYRVQRAQWHLPIEGMVLTPAQRRRVKHKRGERVHDHTDVTSCDRCRGGSVTDPVAATAAAVGPVGKWNRS